MHSSVEVRVLNLVNHNVKLLAKASSVAEIFGISEHLKGKFHRQERIFLHSLEALLGKGI
jgi:hypothetical protein